MKTNIDFIIFAVTQAKAAEKFGFRRNLCCRNLKTALHHYWQHGKLGLSSISQKKKILRSKAAMKKPLRECRVEHTVPLMVIVNRLMDMKPLTRKSVARILEKWFAVRLVTFAEDARLRKRFRSTMPPDWDGKDIFARYKAVGIKVSR